MNEPSAEAEAPSAVKMMENPRTNSAVAMSTWPSLARRAARSNSASETPETNDRYPGIRGTMHGETNPSTPAPNARTRLTSLIS